MENTQHKNGIEIGEQTLLGAGDERPLKFGGNCFSLRCDDDTNYRIVNFVVENLEHCLENGITWPVKILPLDDRRALIDDERISEKWYRSRWCEQCCPEALLPVPQQMAIKRQERRGDRSRHEVNGFAWVRMGGDTSTI